MRMAQVTARHEAVQFPLPTWTMALCAVSRSVGVGGIVFRLRMKRREDADSAQRGNDLPKNILKGQNIVLDREISEERFSQDEGCAP
jgi:hypothetical protein